MKKQLFSKKMLTIALLIGLFALQSICIFAQSINVNFVGAGANVSGTAGVSPAANWNNLNGANGSQSNLIDDSGAATVADIMWTATGSWTSGNPETTEDSNLMEGYLAVNSSTYYPITFTNVPYSSYDVYVYFGNNGTGALGKVRLNGAGTEYFYSVAGVNPNFTGFDLVTSTNSGAPEAGNYVLFSGINVNTSTLVVEQAMNGGAADSGVMGIQILNTGSVVTPTPPPTPETNIALSKTTTTSTGTGADAVDGNLGSRWEGAASDPQWIYVDLGATYDITKVILRWETARASSYQVQVSDNAADWTDIYSTTTGAGGIDTLTGLTGTGRYIRMYGTVRATGYGYSLWEFEVYGTAAATPTSSPSPSPSPSLSPSPSPSPTPSSSPVPTPTSTIVPVELLGFDAE